MAMPASGCIGIIACPNGVACSSIAQAVDGNVTPPKSLCALSIAAGKSAPHGMTEFYGYAPAVTKYADFTCISCTGNNTAIARACSSLDVSPAMVSGEYYCPTFCWWLTSDIDYGLMTLFTVARNGSTVCTCSASPGDYCFGSFSMCVAQGDTVCITTCARVTTGNMGVANESYICLHSMAGGGCSNIYVGSTRIWQQSITCGAIV